MGLAEAWQNIEEHFRADAQSVEARVAQDLPVVAKAVQDAASNPVTVAIASAEHLPEAPSVLQAIADAITSIDGALGAAKAAGAAAAAQPPAEVPADAPAA